MLIQMTIQKQIESYILSLPENKQVELQEMHAHILGKNPSLKLWYMDGKNEDGKVVSNPNIGYGNCMLSYANGTSKAFYRVGLSANSAGISLYFMGLNNKNFLKEKLEDKIGKASITGYCLKFKRLKDINLDVLLGIINETLNLSN